jgi:D-alanyl-D-alanine carboxypeptidase
MLTPQFGENWGYTLGLNYKVLNNGTVVVGHGGDNWGYHGVFNFIIGSKQGIVILTNGDRGAALRTEIIQKWEKLMGGSNLENLWKEEYKKYRNASIGWIIISLFVIVIILLGIRLDFISLDQSIVRKNLDKPKRALVNIIRWILSIGFALTTLFLVIRWGWLNGSFTWRPTIYVFNILVPILLLSWITFGIHFLSIKIKRESK